MQCKCANCDTVCNQSELNQVRDLSQRLDYPVDHPNCILPAGECQKCGSLSYEIPESQVIRISVRCIPGEPTDPDDSDIEGVYQILFYKPLIDLSIEKRASMALDVFHGSYSVCNIEEFEIVVVDNQDDTVGTDETHQEMSGEKSGDIVKTTDVPFLFSHLDRGLDADQLDAKYNPDGEGEHPKYSRADWRAEVAAENTISGYWDWCVYKIDDQTFDSMQIS